MGILLLLMSFIQSFLQCSEGLQKRWARYAVIGGFELPIGILLEAPYGVVGSVVAAFSGLAMLFFRNRHVIRIAAAYGAVVISAKGKWHDKGTKYSDTYSAISDYLNYVFRCWLCRV